MSSRLCGANGQSLEVGIVCKTLQIDLNQLMYQLVLLLCEGGEGGGCDDVRGGGCEGRRGEYNDKSGNIERSVALTTDGTAAGFCSRSALTIWKTSTTPSVLQHSITVEVAQYTPVRLMLSLQGTKVSTNEHQPVCVQHSVYRTLGTRKMCSLGADTYQGLYIKHS